MIRSCLLFLRPRPVIKVEKKLNTTVGLNSRMTQAETVIRSHNDRLKLLEYKSIDIEARSRRNNLLFKGLAKERDDNCCRRSLERDGRQLIHV